MAEKDLLQTSTGLPGVPSGSGTVAPVAAGNPTDTVSTLSGDQNAAEKSVISNGGNRGGRPREDRLVPGSPEAKEADRKKNTESKRLARERERQQRQSTQLPPSLPTQESAVPKAETTIHDAGGVAVFEAGLWVASDFNLCVPSCISFADKYRVNGKTKKAIKGGLPVAVAEEMGAAYALCPEVKDSLRASSPEGLAKIFNALKIPVALKPAISSFPALAYQWARDTQLDEKMDKMIAIEQARLKAIEANKRD